MDKCPICSSSAEVGRPGGGADRKQIVCPRCGHYEMTRTITGMIKNRVEDRQTRGRLSHAIRRRATGDNWPRLDSYNLDEFCKEPLPRPKMQLQLFLRWLADQAGDDRFQSFEVKDEHIAGVIGAVDGDGASAILNKAEDSGLVEYTPDDFYALTVDGWDLVEEVTREEDKQVAKAGERIFIGHGRSHAWRDLKDFLNDRLHLEHDEFNRESVAGITTVERLETMLDHAAFAFIVMTAEDQTVDGQMNPRMNVVHEAGLFAGKLGFRKAIVLLEDGCQEFSNIIGLGQIRFPSGNISAVFEEIRRVLEREGVIRQ